MQNIFEGLVVNEKVIEKNVEAELPFIATENIIMAMVQHGEDRQQVHERIRVLAQQAGNRVKLEGKSNDLLTRIQRDPYFEPIKDSLESMMNPRNFIGRAPDQVEEFIKEEVSPVLEKFEGLLGSAPFLL